MYHKWAQLTLPRDPSIGPVGFLKVDISLIYRGEVQVMPAMVTEEKVEELVVDPISFNHHRHDLAFEKSLIRTYLNTQ